MELTELKHILNTGELPKYDGGKESEEKSASGFSKFLGKHGGSIMSGVTGAIGMVGLIGAASSYNKTANDLLQDAGKSEQNIGGVGYTVQNAVDQGRESAEVSALTTSSTLGLMSTGASTGAAVGSLLGPVGGVVGGAIGAVGGAIAGLFSGGAKKREMRRQMKLAELKRINLNDFNRSGALTTVLQNNLAETEGDQTQQTLYAAANGKESYSAGGPTSGYNARVSNGEIIANKFTGEMFRVPGIPNNKDGKLAFIRPSDTIISNKYGLSDYVALTGDLEGGEAMQGTIMKALGKRGYKNGKLPGFVNGTSIEDNPYYKDLKARLDFVDYMLNNTSGLFRNGYKNGKLPGFKWGLPEWANFGVNAFGALSSMADANSIAKEGISRPNTYSSNWLQGTALNTLKNLRSNVYPIIPEIYNQMGKGMYAINNAGGLSGGQRNLSRLAAMQNAYDTTSKLLQDAQDRNAKYQMAYADAAANLGNEEARRMMNAAQFDYNAYNQAHGAKRLMESQRKADAMNFLEQGVKGLTDMHMWRRMMKHYQDEDDIKREDMRRKYGLNHDGTSATPDYTHYDNKSKYDATNLGDTSYQYSAPVVPSSENIGQWILALINPKGQVKPEPKKGKIKTSSNGGDVYKFNPMISSSTTTSSKPYTSSNGSSQYMFNPMVDPYYTPSDQVTAVLRYLGLPVKSN